MKLYSAATAALCLLVLVQADPNEEAQDISNDAVLKSFVDGRNCTCDGDRLKLYLIDPQDNMIMRYMLFANVTGNDGYSYYSGCDKAYKIESSPFSSWMPPSQLFFLDHIKYFLISVDPYVVPEIGLLSIEYKARAKVNGLHKTPFPQEVLAEDNDVRLASGFAGMIDPMTGLSIGFLLTNDRIYIQYGRLPIARPLLGNYAAFVMIIPLAERCPEQYNNMRMVFDSQSKEIAFLIDGEELYRIQNVGYIQDRRLLVSDAGGEKTLVWPQTLQLLFGSTTALDFYPAATNPACRNPYADSSTCGFPPVSIGLVNTSSANAPPLYNPGTVEQTPAMYYDPEGVMGCHHVWGQGVDMDVKAIKVGRYECLLESPV